MATIWDPEKDKNQQNPMGAGAPPPTPTGTSGTGTQGTSGAAKPTGSGQFTNLQSYIRANENTDAGKQVGSGVLGVADTAVTDAGTAVNKLTSLTPGAGPKAMDTADESWLSTKGSTAPTPYSVINDTEKFAGLKKTYGEGPGTYRGPSLQDVTDSIAAAQTAQEAARKKALILQSGNTAGRAELLRSTYGKDKQYSSGENKLDSFLLERGYGDQFDPKFQGISKTLTDNETKSKTAGDKLTKDIPEIQKQYTDNTEKWRNLLNGAETNIIAAQQAAAAEAAEKQAAAAKRKAEPATPPPDVSVPPSPSPYPDASGPGQANVDMDMPYDPNAPINVNIPNVRGPDPVQGQSNVDINMPGPEEVTPVSPPGSLLPWYGWNTTTGKKIYTIEDYNRAKLYGQASRTPL